MRDEQDEQLFSNLFHHFPSILDVKTASGNWMKMKQLDPLPSPSL